MASRLQAWFATWWILVALVVVLIAGGSLGYFVDAVYYKPILGRLHPTVLTACTLLLMAISLNSNNVARAFLRPKAVLLATFINMGLLPLVAWPVSRIVTPIDFQWGVLIASSVPCTLATAAVFTRRVGGNDAIALLVTLLTNSLCFLITPAWIEVMLAGTATIHVTPLIMNLVIAVLLPTVVGQLARFISPVAHFVDRHKSTFGIAAQGLVLLMILLSVTNAGATLRNYHSAPPLSSTLLVIAVCAGLHTGALGFAAWSSRRIGLHRNDCVAVMFAGSQKTLPVALLVCANSQLIPPDMVFVTFPVIIFHALQLILDVLLVKRVPAPP